MHALQLWHLVVQIQISRTGVGSSKNKHMYSKVWLWPEFLATGSDSPESPAQTKLLVAATNRVIRGFFPLKFATLSKVTNFLQEGAKLMGNYAKS